MNKSGNLPNIPVNSVSVNPNIPKQVFAGTDWGLFYTDNITAASPSWKSYTGLPRVMVWDMSVDRGATTLAIFTRSRGAWALPLPTVSNTQVTLFSDDFETAKAWTTAGGTATCAWTKDSTAGDAHSPSNSWTTHPYGDNCGVNLTSPPISVPAGSNTIRLAFWQKHDSESDTNGGSGCPCDFGQVLLSTNGSTFTSVGNRYEGTELAYSQSTIPLPDSAAGQTIRLRFHFQSDASVSDPVHQGWWVDDVAVTAEPS